MKGLASTDAGFSSFQFEKGHGFAQAILDVVLVHAPDFDAASMEMRASSGGNYLALTCTIRATSREQLDALYTELSDHPMVQMAL